MRAWRSSYSGLCRVQLSISALIYTSSWLNWTEELDYHPPFSRHFSSQQREHSLMFKFLVSDHARHHNPVRTAHIDMRFVAQRIAGVLPGLLVPGIVHDLVADLLLRSLTISSLLRQPFPRAP